MWEESVGHTVHGESFIGLCGSLRVCRETSLLFITQYLGGQSVNHILHGEVLSKVTLYMGETSQWITVHGEVISVLHCT